jgi:flagellar basal body-associated protein FliL
MGRKTQNPKKRRINMALFPLIMIIVFLLLIVGIVIAFYTFKANKEAFEKTGKHPKGHYMGMGMAIGIPLGIPIGLAMGNLALGPAIGVSIGVAIGAALEKQHEDELRPLTKEEEEKRKKLLWIGLGLGTIMLALGVTVFFLVT